MSIRVLLAEDNDVMGSAIERLLTEEPCIELVGIAPSFARTMQMIGDLKPQLLIFDLYMAEKRNFAPAMVKAQFVTVDTVLAVSFANDDEAKQLAESYGAASLLDKMNLYTTLIPAIMAFCSDRSVPPIKLILRRPPKPASEPPAAI